jgi:parallel beta-helix repeat protein
MGNKVTSAIVLALLLTNTLTLTLSIQTAKGWTGTVIIRADGSIAPPSAPISSSDNVTYTLVDGILGSLNVWRDNIVIDGAGYTLQGTGVYGSGGIDLSGRKN